MPINGKYSGTGTMIKKIELYKNQIPSKVVVDYSTFLNNRNKTICNLVWYDDKNFVTNYIDNLSMNNFYVSIGRNCISDPRELKVYVPQANIIFLLDHCTIISGRIVDSCQYIFKKNNKQRPWLVPTRLLS